MALRAPCPMLLLPLVLLLACLALASGQPCFTQNRLFITHHVNNPRTLAPNPRAYCSIMMRRRRIYGKLINTFIHEINKVCTTDGVASGPYKFESKNPFNITICTFNPWSISYTGVSVSEKIVISCWNALPVFYVKNR
uniref:Ribonuclease A-domain domain-containing protein n=1 Tax=Chelydra serpentina TaxID=8475 RepID=A0A8C3SIM5_CHESE